MQYIIDTGPLFDYLFTVYRKQLDTRVIAIPELQYINSQLRFRAFERFVGMNRPLLTVSGVIVEVGRLFHREMHKRMPSSPMGFWRCAYATMLGNKSVIEEKLIELCSLDVEIVGSYGPVDASLCRVAQEFRAKNKAVSIVTGDQVLWGAQKQRIPMVWIGEVVDAGAS